MPRYHDDYDFGRLRRSRRQSSRDNWKFWLWMVFSVCAFISFLMLGLVWSRGGLAIIAACYGGLLVVLSIILLFIVNAHEERLNPPQGTDMLGVGVGVIGGMSGVVIYFMLRHAGRWPQPLLTLLLAIATITGAVFLDRSPREQADARPLQLGPQQAPQQPPPQASPPKADPLKPPPKTEWPDGIDPVAKQADKTLYLGAMTPTAYKPGPWKYAVGFTGADAEAPIKVQGKEYKWGLSASPPNSTTESCFISYAPGGEFKRLKGWAALNDYAFAPWGKTAFAVWGDGRKLWESDPLDKAGAAIGFDIDVTGVKSLTLETRVKEGSHIHGHAVWLDPWLER